jgi:hypothetical protein
LGKRFRSLLEQFSSSPGDSIPLVRRGWANTKAAYRFFDNDRVSEAEILGGQFQATRDRDEASGVSSLSAIFLRIAFIDGHWDAGRDFKVLLLFRTGSGTQNDFGSPACFSVSLAV